MRYIDWPTGYSRSNGHNIYHLCNSLQRSLLFPAYCTTVHGRWRRFRGCTPGMRGVPSDTLPGNSGILTPFALPSGAWIAPLSQLPPPRNYRRRRRSPLPSSPPHVAPLPPPPFPQSASSRPLGKPGGGGGAQLGAARLPPPDDPGAGYLSLCVGGGEYYDACHDAR